MYSQEQPSFEEQLDKTYGYIKSHELLALKVQQNYPELAPRIQRATELFYLNFGPGLKKMDRAIQQKYRNEYPELPKKLIELGSSTFSSVTKVEAEKFLQRYEHMSVGRIKSPYLETLLAQQYDQLPLVNHYHKFNQLYSVSNFSKNELIKIQLKIPNNWSELFGKDHELILKKFRNNLGNGNIILNIVKVEHDVTKSNTTDLDALISELIPTNASINQSTKKTMGNQLAYYVNYTDQQASINSKFKRNVSLYILEEPGMHFILDFSIYTLNEDKNELTSDILGLFDQIVSTVHISKRSDKKSLVSNKY